MAVSHRVRVLGYRVATTDRLQDFDLRGWVDGVAGLTPRQLPDHFLSSKTWLATRVTLTGCRKEQDCVGERRLLAIIASDKGTEASAAGSKPD